MTKDHRRSTRVDVMSRPEKYKYQSYSFVFSDDLKDWGVSRARESRANQRTKGNEVLDKLKERRLI